MLMPRLALCRAALRSGTPVRLRVTGISMLPRLWPGDSVTVHAATFDEIARGDVVAFARDQHLIVHRVSRKSSAGGAVQWFTRGDAQRHEDAPLLPEELLGIVTSYRRLGREHPMAGGESGAAWALSHTLGRVRLARALVTRMVNLIMPLLTKRATSG